MRVLGTLRFLQHFYWVLGSSFNVGEAFPPHHQEIARLQLDVLHFNLILILFS